MKWFVLAVVAAYYLYVIIALLRFGGYSMWQKVAQLVVMVVFPVLGAMLVHSFIRSTLRSTEKYDREFIPDEGGNPPGIGM